MVGASTETTPASHWMMGARLKNETERVPLLSRSILIVLLLSEEAALPTDLTSLEAARRELLEKIAKTNDMRQGSITETFRKCGKKSCACAGPRHPGHGPFYAFTRKVDGKTKTIQLRRGPALDKLEREVQTYKGFRKDCEHLLELNDKICDARPSPTEGSSLEKKRYPPPSPRRSRTRSIDS
jgi:hypothetical protein